VAPLHFLYKAFGCTGRNCLAQSTTLGCVVVWPLSAHSIIYSICVASERAREKRRDRERQGKTQTKPQANTHTPWLSRPLPTAPIANMPLLWSFFVAWQSVENVQQLSASHCEKTRSILHLLHFC